jgi:hypothetical protein
MIISSKARLDRKRREEESSLKEETVTGLSQPSWSPPIVVSVITRGGCPELLSSTVDGEWFDAATAEPEFSVSDDGDVSPQARRRRMKSATKMMATMTIRAVQSTAPTSWTSGGTSLRREAFPASIDRSRGETLPSAAGINDTVSHQLKKKPKVFIALFYNRRVVFVRTRLDTSSELSRYSSFDLAFSTGVINTGSVHRPWPVLSGLLLVAVR